MNDKIIIAIHGKMRSGKDTLGKLIKNFLEVNPDTLEHDKKDSIKLYKFADPIKQSLSATWGIPVKELEKDEVKNSLSPLGITWRELMQAHGKKLKEIDEDYFCKALFNRIDNDPSKICIITDWRFPNETEFIENHNGIKLKVMRDKVEVFNGKYISREEYEGLNNSTSDISETSLDNYNSFDYIIDNNLSMWDLSGSVYNLLKKLNINYSDI